MENGTDYIVFVVLVACIMISVMIFVVADIMLRYRNQQLHNEKEKLELQKRYEDERESVREELIKQLMLDLSHELHDNITQPLILARLNLGGFIDEALLQDCRQNISQAIHDIRALSHILNDENESYYDLVTSLERTHKRLSRGGILRVEFNIGHTVRYISSRNGVVVLNILQELINNTLKHSQSKLLHLDMQINDHVLHIRYWDEGVGCDGTIDYGLGLKSIARRMEMLHGEWNIDTGPGKGFAFTASMAVRANDEMQNTP